MTQWQFSECKVPYKVYCEPLGTVSRSISSEVEQEWILMQSRVSTDDTFSWKRNWTTYKQEFGSACSNYWIGLERLYQITNVANYRLRVEVQQRTTGNWYWAEYSNFSVGSEETGYVLTVEGLVEYFHLLLSLQCNVIRALQTLIYILLLGFSHKAF